MVLVYAVVLGWFGHRIWRFIAVDTLTKSLRDRLFTEIRREKRLYEYARLWLQCPWCAGTWITVVLTVVSNWLIEGGIPAPVLAAGAACSLTGFLGTYDPGHQQQQMEGGG